MGKLSDIGNANGNAIGLRCVFLTYPILFHSENKFVVIVHMAFPVLFNC